MRSQVPHLLYCSLEYEEDRHIDQMSYLPPPRQVKSNTQMMRSQVDIFIMGIGSVTGVGKYLKEKNPNAKMYGVEPAEANILNGGKPGPHLVTGNGVGFKPDILDMDIMEKVLEVKGEDAHLHPFPIVGAPRRAPSVTRLAA